MGTYLGVLYAAAQRGLEEAHPSTYRSFFFGTRVSGALHTKQQPALMKTAFKTVLSDSD
jgi:hypothetical protein